MKKQYLALFTVLALFLCIISILIIYNQWPLMTGQRIILATQPVDPFDPFMGQYMAINYEISNINNYTGNFNSGDNIYVLLEKDSTNIWRESGFSRSKPSTEDFIMGKILHTYGSNTRIEYGIEQFYFEQNAELPTRNITVEVAIASSGRAKLVQLLYNGKPLDIKYKKFDIRA